MITLICDVCLAGPQDRTYAAYNISNNVSSKQVHVCSVCTHQSPFNSLFLWGYVDTPAATTVDPEASQDIAEVAQHLNNEPMPTDEEILYYATSYYDELQNAKSKVKDEYATPE